MKKRRRRGGDRGSRGADRAMGREVRERPRGARAGAGNDPRAAKAADARESRRVSPRIVEYPRRIRAGGCRARTRKFREFMESAFFYVRPVLPTTV